MTVVDGDFWRAMVIIHTVSILVLVDDGRRLGRRRRMARTIRRFNPCSCG